MNAASSQIRSALGATLKLMFKQTSLIAFLLVLVSCGQEDNNKSQVASADTSTKSRPTIDTTKENKAATIKGEAYNTDIKIWQII
jgi:hypothetical protein